MSDTETVSASRQAILDAARDAARPFAADTAEAVFRALAGDSSGRRIPEIIGGSVAAVAAAVYAAIEPRIRADERARLRSLVPYNANCCEGFPAAVADILGEHGDAS